MTARMQLNRRMRWLGSAVYAGTALFVSGILLGLVLGQPPVLAISIPGFAAAWLASMAGFYVGLLRCPWCRANLGALVMQHGVLAINRRVCFCPYCGVGLDEELPVETQSQSDER